MSSSIVIIDYGSSNLLSVYKALKILGYSVFVTQNTDEIREAKVVVLPGVGTAGEALNEIKAKQLDKLIISIVEANKPFLGICLGLQLLFTEAEESGGCECLDLIKGRVVRLPETVKVPHIGWNQVKQVNNHPIFRGIPDNSNFYFAHSYYAKPDNESSVVGKTQYGVEFASIISYKNLVATQFHPEKSGNQGLAFLDNVMSFAGLHK